MRLVVQRVTRAGVEVEGEVVGSIRQGLMVLAGFGPEDGPDLPQDRTWKAMLSKLAEMRVFPDDKGRLNLSLNESGGQLLLVPQFTLYADCRRGRRPSFSDAAPPELALKLFSRLVADMKELLPGKVEQGRFGAEMFVDFVNWGPVTLILDSLDFRAPRRK